MAVVIGESAASRKRESENRVWKLHESSVSEVDEQHHIGILRSMYNSTINRTNERATAGRSAFFALNSVGSRFGCLHPLMALRLYHSICLPILTYGCEVWTITRMELLFLERVHRKILRTIQGLPLRCPSTTLTTLLGIQSISDIIKQRKLGFLATTVGLPADSLARRICEVRACADKPKGVVKSYQELLLDLNLPDLSELLSNPPKVTVWKAHVRNYLAFKAHLDFAESCEAYHLSSCALLQSLQEGSPAALPVFLVLKRAASFSRPSLPTNSRMRKMLAWVNKRSPTVVQV